MPDQRSDGRFECRVPVRLHADQKARLVAAGKRHGLRLGPYLREAALAYSEQRFLLPQNLSERLVDLERAVVKVGSNVNAIAAKTNSRGVATEDDVRQTQALVRSYLAHVRYLRAVCEEIRPSDAPAS